MSIDLVGFAGDVYPAFQAQWNAARFAIPYAKLVCKGTGYDIGCGTPEWCFPGAMPIDVALDDEFTATNLPDRYVDYIFSSHCLEHLNNWVDVLDYWTSKLNVGGVLFLYLPHYSQKYWRPWNNRKHKSVFTSTVIRGYMEQAGYINIFHSDRDLNHSFMVFGEKGG
jgi:predicted SAM-dependent methyltransferase